MNKYQTREERLRNKISEELTHPKPNVERLIEIANEFEEVNLETIKKLTRVKKTDDSKIKGALRQTINAHGPITMELIGSATKRINGSLLLNENFTLPKPLVDDRFSIKGILLGALCTAVLLIGIYFIVH